MYVCVCVCVILKSILLVHFLALFKKTARWPNFKLNSHTAYMTGYNRNITEQQMGNVASCYHLDKM